MEFERMIYVQYSTMERTLAHIAPHEVKGAEETPKGTEGDDKAVIQAIPVARFLIARRHPKPLYGHAVGTVCCLHLARPQRIL
ncbi:MAG: hypothetical protein QGH33_05585 [Pirellulaceae bacterium]|nr:hypothetical protein [Pirellulaceae bacterium]